MDSFSKNEKQQNFNQINGYISELNDGHKFCSITITVGHENKRFVNLVIKKADFENVRSVHSVGDKVAIRYFLSSRKNDNKYTTMANVLSVENIAG